MKNKGFLVGVFFVIGLTVIVFYLQQNSHQRVPFDESLLIIEDSVYDILTESEISQMQDFAQRATVAADGNPAIFSPHAKYLSNGSIVAYMMFVNNTGETVTSLHSISVKMIAGNNQTIAGGVFPSIRNMPSLPPDTIFLFSVVFNQESVQQTQADLASYFTETFFEYKTVTD